MIDQNIINNLYDLDKRNITKEDIGEILANMAIDADVHYKNASNKTDKQYYYNFQTFIIILSERIDRRETRNGR